MAETTTIDTLTIAENLIEAGLAVGVAKKQAHILGDFFGKLSTKEGVEKEIGDMRKDMVNMEGEVEQGDRGGEELGKMGG